MNIVERSREHSLHEFALWLSVHVGQLEKKDYEIVEKKLLELDLTDDQCDHLFSTLALGLVGHYIENMPSPAGSLGGAPFGHPSSQA